MNGRLDKVAMTNKLMQLKRELHYKCEIGEKGEWECKGEMGKEHCTANGHEILGDILKVRMHPKRTTLVALTLKVI